MTPTKTVDHRRWPVIWLGFPKTMRMTKGLLRVVLAACLSAVLLPAAPAAAAGKGKGALLGSLAKGTLNNVLGNELSSVLTDLGVFEMIGLGAGATRSSTPSSIRSSTS